MKQFNSQGVLDRLNPDRTDELLIVMEIVEPFEFERLARSSSVSVIIETSDTPDFSDVGRLAALAFDAKDRLEVGNRYTAGVRASYVKRWVRVRHTATRGLLRAQLLEWADLNALRA